MYRRSIYRRALHGDDSDDSNKPEDQKESFFERIMRFIGRNAYMLCILILFITFYRYGGWF